MHRSLRPDITFEKTRANTGSLESLEVDRLIGLEPINLHKSPEEVRATYERIKAIALEACVATKDTHRTKEEFGRYTESTDHYSNIIPYDSSTDLGLIRTVNTAFENGRIDETWENIELWKIPAEIDAEKSEFLVAGITDNQYFYVHEEPYNRNRPGDREELHYFEMAIELFKPKQRLMTRMLGKIASISKIND